MRQRVTLLVTALAGATGTAGAQAPCPAAADSLVASGWIHYRTGAVDLAHAAFTRALARCPGHLGGQVGLGYAALRGDDTATARQRFAAVLARDSTVVDALAGLGMLAWREGALAEVRQRFERVLALDSTHEEARAYLERLRALTGAPRPRVARRLPDTVEYTVRAGQDRFETLTPGGWRPFYVKGVNLGAALPGRYPSEFPDSSTYAAWLDGIGQLGANTVRLYTLHPPAFYDALADFNRSHPDAPLYLLQGIWAELPPRDDFDDREWKAAWLTDAKRVVDAVHGAADISPRPGHASGFYVTDVSDWTLGYLLGREWEPEAVQAFNMRGRAAQRFDGRYLMLERGAAMDRWLAEVSDAVVAHEVEVYRAQHPVGYTNWPTLDALSHESEATPDEEVAIRRALGVVEPSRSAEHANDGVTLDPTRIRPTARFGAGWFAAYHVYPFYPDFLLHDTAYAGARSSQGPSRYYGYLTALRRAHGRVPVLVAEYGVAAGLGISHIHPDGWHHGGLEEARMAQLVARMTYEIAEAGFAGGIVFEWMDEWFKTNWLTAPLEIPDDRRHLWLNRLDPEEHFGLVAIEPTPPLPGGTLAERLTAWRALAPVAETRDGSLRAAADAGQLWLLFEARALGRLDTIYLGFDVVDPGAGGFRLPGGAGARLPVGIELLLEVTPETARILAQPAANPLGPLAPLSEPPGHVARPAVRRPPAGFFAGRLLQALPSSRAAGVDESGRYEPLLAITNRRRFGRDTTEYPALGYERGVLRPGPPPDGAWERDDRRGALEVRVPWSLLNVTDPSRRRVLRLGTGDTGTAVVDGVRLVVASRGAGEPWRLWTTEAGDARAVTWRGWDQPAWTARRRPAFEAVRRAFADVPHARPAPPPDSVIDAAWNAGDLAAAERLYAARLAADSADERALYRLALLLAWDRRFEPSLALFDRLVALAPGDADVRRERAKVLSWARAYDRSIADYRALVRRDATDRSALLGLAQVLSWSGRFDSAAAWYGRLLEQDSTDLDARRGLARVAAWRGALPEAERRWRAVLARDPDDRAARVGLSQTLRWQGRPGEAWAALEPTMRQPTDDAELRAERAQVRAALAPQVSPQVRYETDSDGNDATTLQLRGGWYPTPRIRLGMDAAVRYTDSDLGLAPDGRATVGVLDARMTPAPGWSVSLGLGAAGSDAPGAPTGLVARAGVATPPLRGVAVTAGVRREPLHVTAQLIQRDVYLADGSIALRAEPGRHWSLEGGYAYTVFDGTRTNHRHQAHGGLTRRLARDWFVGGRLRVLGFANDLDDGYFDPALYGLGEIPLVWSRGLGGAHVRAEAAPGLQLIHFDGLERWQATLSASARVAYLVGPGREVGVTALFSRSGLERLTTPVGGYRYLMLGAFGSWAF